MAFMGHQSPRLPFFLPFFRFFPTDVEIKPGGWMWDVAGLGSSGIDPSRAVCSILLIKTGEGVIRQTDLYGNELADMQVSRWTTLGTSSLSEQEKTSSNT